MEINCFDLTYGLNPLGRLVSIGEVMRGLACDCTCPHCGEKLEAKKGNKRIHHFAHHNPHHGGNTHSSSKRECYYGTIHRLAIDILAEEKCVMIPQYETIPAKKISFEMVEVEKRKDQSDLQPDVVGITNEGKRYQIEIKYSHRVSEEKLEKIRESGYMSLEIDISQQEMDREKLKHFLLETDEERRWLNNPDYQKIIEEKRQKRDRERENQRQQEEELRNRNQEQRRNRIINEKKLNQQEKYWNNSCFCLCPPNSYSIDEYYNRLRPNLTFYQDETKSTNILNYLKNGDMFVVIHDNPKNYNIYYTIVLYHEGRLIHSTYGTFRYEFQATKVGKKRIGL